jgi:hypothetical protein
MVMKNWEIMSNMASVGAEAMSVKKELARRHKEHQVWLIIIQVLRFP